MSTTTVKSIGTSSRDYSTVATWEAACPANLTTSISGGEIWQGEMYNDSQFTEENTTIFGMTVDATGYVVLKTASGQSAFDTASNPLQYDQSKGVGWLGVTGYSNHITNSVDYTQMEGIQFKRTTSGSGVVAFNQGAFSNQRIRRCLADNVRSHSSFVMSSGKVINTVVINRHATTARGITFSYGGGGINCTCVVPTSVTANGTAYTKGSGAGSETIDNCASFGFTNAVSASFDGGDYNCTDAASGMPGANSQHSLTYADQFVSTTADWKLKTGSNLIGGGNTDATNAPNDIFGTARGSGTAGDCGAHEFVASGSDVTVSPGFGNLVLTGYSPTVSFTDNKFASPGVGNLTITGYAPTVTRTTSDVTIATGLGELVITGHAPTVSRTENVIVNPETGALIITGYAPTTIHSGSFTVTPDLANLILTGYAPTVSVSSDIAPQVGQTPAGSSAKRRDQRRRRIMLPDGTLIWATFDEAYDILAASTKQVEAKVSQTVRAKVSREALTKPIERREVKWVPVQDTMAETYKVVLPQRLEFMPSGESYQIAMATLKRRMDDEEAAMLLLLH